MAEQITKRVTYHGSKSSIGLTALVLTATSVQLHRGLTIKAADANSGKVYVGNSNVTNGSTDATDGFELGAGQSLTLDFNDPSLVYVIGSTAGQKVFWIGD